MIPPIPEILEPVQVLSNKVKELKVFQENKDQLILPEKRYQPFFVKVMIDFIEHHGIVMDKSNCLPDGSMKIHLALSRILDVMVHSMGENKRSEIMKELDEYKKEIPSFLKT